MAAPHGHNEAQEVLFAWVADLYRGTIQRSVQTAGGNRQTCWAIDVANEAGTHPLFLRYAPDRPPGAEPYTVRREAQVYRAIEPGIDAGLRAPRLLAEHPRYAAVLTERFPGIAEFRRLTDPAAKQAIVADFMDSLARLHRMDAAAVTLDGGVAAPRIADPRIADHVRAELATWRAMYAETARPDGLIELALDWLDAHVPDPDGSAVLVHGDAGPGNFLFEDGRMTALIDWELAHLGDPMEDLAWFSMRCVMEPVPDFAAALADYARLSGTAVDRARVLYHRVFVSARVVVIRHRNVTGEPAYALVSRALNRRLLVEALADASGTPVEVPAPLEASPTPRTALYDHVLADLRDVVVARSTDSQVIAKAKNAAKVIKYLQAQDRFGPLLAAEAATPPPLDFAGALRLYAVDAAREAQLAAGASGGIAHRHYPPL